MTMQLEDDAIVVELSKKANKLSDDQYLVDMTGRIKKLRALLDEQESRRRRSKRWADNNSTA